MKKRARLRRRAEEAARDRAAGSTEDLKALPPEKVRQLVQELRVHQIELEMQNDELSRTQAELASQRERYFDLYDLAPVGYFTVSEKGLVIEANLTAVRLLGVPRASLLKQPFTRFILPEDQDIYYLSRKRLFDTGAPQVCEVRMLNKDAAPPGAPSFQARLEAALARREGGPVSRVVVSDVTEHAQYEKALMNMHRLESLGSLAGGIAHDFNNILTAILGNISLLESMVKSDRVALELVKEAQEACGTAKGLACQMLTFAKGGFPVVRSLDLRPLLTQAAGFAARGSGSRCVFDLGEIPLTVNADPDQVSQVVQNLILNATQAMRKSGEIKVRASTVTLGEGEHPALDAGRYVRVSVEDPGSGIEAAHMPKVFDPYFSTKATGRGLGLAVCHSIMAKHGGHIGAESTLGAGSVFTLHFPAAEARAPSGMTQPPAADPHAGTGRRVLVMDDDASVAKVLKRILEHLGFQADCVEDGQAALDAYRKAMEAGKPYDAVVMDLTVPGGMGGKETIGKLIRLDPKAKAIVSSGYSNDPVMSEYAARGFSGVLTKPYRLEEVADALRRIIGPGRS